MHDVLTQNVSYLNGSGPELAEAGMETLTPFF